MADTPNTNTPASQILFNKVNSLEAKLKQIEAKDKFINQLENRVKTLEKESIDLKIKINTLYQYGRHEHIELVGVKESIKQEDLERYVIDLLNEIEVEVTERDIAAVHRLGKFRRQKKRNVIIKFIQRKDAKKAYKNRSMLKRLNGEFKNIYIIENLCPAHRTLFNRLYRMLKNDEIYDVWTHNGHVYATFEDIEGAEIQKESDITYYLNLYATRDDRGTDPSVKKPPLIPGSPSEKRVAGFLESVNTTNIMYDATNINEESTHQTITQDSSSPDATHKVIIHTIPTVRGVKTSSLDTEAVNPAAKGKKISSVDPEAITNAPSQQIKSSTEVAIVNSDDPEAITPATPVKLKDSDPDASVVNPAVPSKQIKSSTEAAIVKIVETRQKKSKPPVNPPDTRSSRKKTNTKASSNSQLLKELPPTLRSKHSKKETVLDSSATLLLEDHHIGVVTPLPIDYRPPETIVNLHDIEDLESFFKDDNNVYVGRYNPCLPPGISDKWGNPYDDISTPEKREQSIASYREDLMLNHDLLNDLEELRGKTLCCWCSPDRCHAEVLIELVNMRICKSR